MKISELKEGVVYTCERPMQSHLLYKVEDGHLYYARKAESTNWSNSILSYNKAIDADFVEYI